MSRNYRTNEVILLLICGSIAFAGLVQAQDGFNLSVMRSPTASNSIRLTCTNAHVPVSDPQFFLDRTKRVDDLNGFTRERNELTFKIKRELEGNYTCGSLSVQSNSVAIVAKPTLEINFDPTPPRVYALVQQPQVHLNCAIPPGRLLQRYYVTWYKSDERIYETNPGSMPYMKSDRYSLNPTNLSIIINNVQLDDMSDEYHCVLRVLVSTITGSLERYNILDTIDIPLTVLASPEITQPPNSLVVVEDEEDVYFKCAAMGNPTPNIKWMHRGETVYDDDNEDTEIDTIREGHNVTSTLVFLSVDGHDSGMIQCIAEVPPDEDVGPFGDELDDASEDATLSVLGEFVRIAVRITVDRDVLFEIHLPAQLQDPVKLYLLYSDPDSGQTEAVISTAVYRNVMTIYHLEYDSDVAFERFQVTVGLVSADDPDMRGPLRHAGQYDKSVPNIPVEELIRQAPVISVCVVLVFAILCTSALFMYAIKKFYQNEREKRKKPDRVDHDSTLRLEKKLDKNPNGMYSLTSAHCMKDEDAIIVSIVDKYMPGPVEQPPTGGIHQIRKRLSRKRPNDIHVENGTSKPQGELCSKGTHTVTIFLAKKALIGLRHPTKGKKFRKVVKKLLKVAKRDNEESEEDSDSDSEVAPLVRNEQRSVTPQEN